MLDPFQRLASDKRGHCFAGMIAGLVAVTILPLWWAPLAGALLVGIGKEIADSFDRANHTVDPLDAAATALGGALISAGTVVVQALQ